MSDSLEAYPAVRRALQLGGKIVPFAGYEMLGAVPQRTHGCAQGCARGRGSVRCVAYGRVPPAGRRPWIRVQKVTVNDASKMAVGQAQYSAMCLEYGGIIDDLIVYRFADHWMLVVNASNKEKDLSWVRKQADGLDVEVEDVSDETALIALQGPAAREILRPLLDIDVDAVRYYHFMEGAVNGAPAVIAGTGYTREDGFELAVGNDAAAEVWRAILDAGEGSGLIAAGLGARDSSAWRWAIPSTATTWTRNTRPWSPDWPGSPNWIRATSSGATPS